MEWFVGWIVFSLVVGWVWQARGLSFGAGLIISILLSPLIGLIIGLVKKPTVQEQEQQALEGGGMKKCPFCAELVKSEAVLCRFCGKEFPATQVSGSRRYTRKELHLMKTLHSAAGSELKVEEAQKDGSIIRVWLHHRKSPEGVPVDVVAVDERRNGEWRTVEDYPVTD